MKTLIVVSSVKGEKGNEKKGRWKKEPSMVFFLLERSEGNITSLVKSAMKGEIKGRGRR